MCFKQHSVQKYVFGSKTLKNIEKDALHFNMYDAVYYFSDGKFSKIEKP